MREAAASFIEGLPELIAKPEAMGGGVEALARVFGGSGGEGGSRGGEATVVNTSYYHRS